MKKTPPAVLNKPTLFLKSAKLIPASCAPLLAGVQEPFAFKGPIQLNVARPEEMKKGTPVDQVTIAPVVQPPTIRSTKRLELFKKA